MEKALESSKDLKETTICIKGFDYEDRNTINQYSLLSTIGRGSISKIFLA